MNMKKRMGVEMKSEIKTLKYYRENKENLTTTELSEKEFYDEIINYCNDDYFIGNEYQQYVDCWGTDDFKSLNDYKNWWYLNCCETIKDYGIEVERYCYYIKEVEDV